MKKAFFSVAGAFALLFFVASPVLASAAATISATTFNRTLSLGVRGSDVQMLQQFLIAQGFLSADSATGYFGLLTQRAVQQFQVKNNIVSAGTPATTGYGMVGPKTRLFLTTLLKSTGNTSNSSALGIAVSPTPSVSPTATQTGTYRAYSNGNLFITTTNYTKEDALGNCKANANTTLQRVIRCTWNDVEIFSYTPPSMPTTSSAPATTPTPPPTPLACSWAGQSVASGQSITAYQSSSVTYGQQCSSEVRTCSNGTLSGSAVYQSCSVAAAPVFVTSARLSGNQESSLISWIDSLQFKDVSQQSYGAILISAGTALYEPGTNRPLERVVPYFSSIGVIGALDTADSRRFALAQGWLQWYLSHLDASTGVPLDTWYSADGTYETTCPVSGDATQCNHVDAEDSSAALFFVVAQKYLDAGGDASVLSQRGAAVKKVADAMLALIDTDGLSFAKQSYRMKYTMDNAEVYAGLLAVASVNSRLAGALGTADYVGMATKIKTAMGPSGSLRSQNGLLYWAQGNAANLATWYPDDMAQLWPYIFGVISDNSSTSPYAQALAAITGRISSTAFTNADCAALRAATGGTDEPSLTYAMYLQGDTKASALAQCEYTANASAFAWPFNVAQAGWLLRR